MARGELIFDGTFARAICFHSGSRNLLVTFDNWREGRAGFPRIRPSQTVRDAGFTQLSIQTSRNDWYLSPELPLLQATLVGFAARFAVRRAIAFSMGGYGALLLAQTLRLQRALLASPQLTMFPDKHPFDARFAKDAALLEPQYDTVAQTKFPDLGGVILFDPRIRQDDRGHAHGIAKIAPGLVPVAMPLEGHPALHVITEANLFGELLMVAMTGAVVPAEVRDIHKRARELSAAYEARMIKFLKHRLRRTGRLRN